MTVRSPNKDVDAAVPAQRSHAGSGAAARPLTARTTLARFAAVGVASTVVHLGLFWSLAHAGVEAQLANLVALILATVANTAANRSWTFGVTSRSSAVAHHVQGLAIFAVTAGLTSGALGLLQAAQPGSAASMKTVVVAVATAASTLARFAVMRRWR